MQRGVASLFRSCHLGSMARMKNKGPLQRVVESEIARTPEIFARQLIHEKLEALGIQNEDLAADLVRYVMGDRTAEVEARIDAAAGPDVVISFGPEDIDRLKEFQRNLSQELPELLLNMSSEAAGPMLADYKRQWRAYRPHEIESFDQFKTNLQARWGKGLDALRMLLELCRDIGSEFMETRARARKHSHRAEALIALHMRACQVTSEIICLLENGFADGATARWRTLHEISVVATLIGDGDETLAKRYLDHEAIEAKRALDTYDACETISGREPASTSARRGIVSGFESAVKKYGPDFSGHFGWAAGYYNGNKNPKFVHLQEAAGRAAMQSDYKTASYNVHASARGLFGRPSASVGSYSMVAGATNAGLANPGKFTAYSLVQITGMLLGKDMDLDQMARIRATLQLRDEIPGAFSEAASKLRRDEIRVQRQLSRPSKHRTVRKRK